MIRTLASILLLGMIPHEGLQEFAYSLPSIDVVPIAAPRAYPADLAFPEITASGALLMDLASGQTLYEKEAHTQRQIGSLTKMMTALLMLESHEPGESVTIADSAVRQQGSAIGLTAGQHFLLQDLLIALLLPSANDVAYALALHDSTSADAFVEKMNARAAVLGLKDTTFANPAGFDDLRQRSTPHDIAALARSLLRKPELKAIVRRRHATIFSSEGTKFDLTNTNELLHSQRNVYGIKTGTTDGAGQCLTTLFTLDGREYLLVLLGSTQRYADAMRIIDTLDAAHTVL